MCLALTVPGLAPVSSEDCFLFHIQGRKAVMVGQTALPPQASQGGSSRLTGAAAAGKSPPSFLWALG